MGMGLGPDAEGLGTMRCFCIVSMAQGFPVGRGIDILRHLACG